MKKHLLLNPFTISALVVFGGIFVYLSGVPFLDFMELKTIDLRFESRGAIRPRPEVVRRLRAADLAGASCGICTHNLAHPADDPVLRACREAGITNRPGDSVRLMFVPVMLDGRDPVLPVSYADVLYASDLSVFPSTYEPWGYTPLECVALGVPAVTSDLAGFGRYVAETYPDHDRWGVNLVQRRGCSFHEAAADLTGKLLEFCRLERRGRIAAKTARPGASGACMARSSESPDRSRSGYSSSSPR